MAIYNLSNKMTPKEEFSMNRTFTKIVAIVLAIAMAGSVLVAGIQVLF